VNSPDPVPSAGELSERLAAIARLIEEHHAAVWRLRLERRQIYERLRRAGVERPTVD